jgi:hypothetical protein
MTFSWTANADIVAGVDRGDRHIPENLADGTRIRPRPTTQAQMKRASKLMQGPVGADE